MDPLTYWLSRDNCTADPSTCNSGRLGFTEAKYIEHEYAYLDAIAGMKNGKMVLGNCASGGRRLDIEMLRRMTVNSRSDNCMDPLSAKVHIRFELVDATPWPERDRGQICARTDYDQYRQRLLIQIIHGNEYGLRL